MVLMFEQTRKTEQTYELKCKITTKKKQFQDQTRKDDKWFNDEVKLVILVPEESSQKVFFLDAHMPSVEDENSEVVGVILSPINKPSRFNVQMANENFPEPHIIVMSEHIREEILKMLEWWKKERKEGEPTIRVDILPISKEEELDV